MAIKNAPVLRKNNSPGDPRKTGGHTFRSAGFTAFCGTWPAAARHRLETLILISVGIIVLGTSSEAVGQTLLPSDEVTVGVSSGFVANAHEPPTDGLPGAPEVVFSTVVGAETGSWVRLHFGEVALSGSPAAGTGSFIRITSMQDGDQQILDAESLKQWRYKSAIFQGPQVEIELLAYPSTGPSSIEIAKAIVGREHDHDATRTSAAGGCGRSCSCGSTGICGVDDRFFTFDPRTAQLIINVTGGGLAVCTAFMIDDPNRCFLTAGSCVEMGTLDFVQFYTSHLDDYCPPIAILQFPVDALSVQHSNTGPGDNWGYFGTTINLTTGLTAFEMQLASYSYARELPTMPDNGTLRRIGYGCADYGANDVGCHPQQSDFGTFDAYDPTNSFIIEYDDLDAASGDEGGPLVHMDTGLVYGIHTTLGCAGVGFNSGTAIDNPDLLFAIANPMGVCAGIPDCNNNGTSDLDDLALGTSADVNSNNYPDECENVQGCCFGATTCIDLPRRYCLSLGGNTLGLDALGFPIDCASGDCTFPEGSWFEGCGTVPSELPGCWLIVMDSGPLLITNYEFAGLVHCGMDAAGEGHLLFGGTVTGFQDTCIDAADIQMMNSPGCGQCDCNRNGIRDTQDFDPEFEFGMSTDVNGNLIPDECEGGDCNDNGIPDPIDIINGTSLDCNFNLIPDECEPNCHVELIFAVDTSGSMTATNAALCAVIDDVIADVLAEGFDLDVILWGIAEGKGDPTCVVNCAADCFVAEQIGTGVPGDGSCGPLTHPESWGPATAVVAAGFTWDSDPKSFRLVAPVSDEGACRGDPSDQEDTDAITNAIAVANDPVNRVVAIPITGFDSPPEVITQADNLAAGTGGQAEHLEPGGDVEQVLRDFLVSVITSLPCEDCNENGIIDECECDCNGNGFPDDCDIADGTSDDENGNGIPDECEPVGEYEFQVNFYEDGATGWQDPSIGVATGCTDRNSMVISWHGRMFQFGGVGCPELCGDPLAHGGDGDGVFATAPNDGVRFAQGFATPWTELVWMRRFDPFGIPLDAEDVQMVVNPDPIPGAWFCLGDHDFPSGSVQKNSEALTSNVHVSWTDFYSSGWNTQLCGPLCTDPTSCNKYGYSSATWGESAEAFSPATVPPPDQCLAMETSTAYGSTQFLTAWVSIDNCTSIKYRLNDGDENTLIGHTFDQVVSEPCAGSTADDNRFVVIWTEVDNTFNTTTLKGRRIDDTVPGAVFDAAPQAILPEGAAAVAVFDDGSFAVVYYETANPGEDQGLKIKRFDSADPPNELATEPIDVEDGLGGRFTVAVTGDSVYDGRIVVVWQGFRIPYYREYVAASGEPLGAGPEEVPFDIDPNVPKLLGRSRQHTAVIRPDGALAVVWSYDKFIPQKGSVANIYCTVRRLFGGTSCPADFNNDGEIDAFDLAILLGAWGPNPGHPADLDDNGDVGAFDLAILLGNWGPCNP